jgi:hypothetical protein
VRRTKAVVLGYEYEDQREIDVIMISHKFDTSPLYLTLPEIYENPENEEEYLPALDEISKHILANAADVPENMIPID